MLLTLVGGVSTLYLGASPALGSIQDQRERLPPAESCADAVEGVWMSKQYFASHRDWYVFTLEIHRKAEARQELTGEILSHFWTGSSENETPPPCGPRTHEVMIKMPGSGTVESTSSGDRIFFGANTYEVERVVCGSEGRYNPDNFSGTIDPARQEFQSVNNDGGRSVNDPHLFRRIRCLEAAPAPAPIEPPRPAPPASRSCACGL